MGAALSTHWWCTSNPPSAEKLPPEVWEVIMDELESDATERSRLLENCSLVSPSWRRMAQRRILHKVAVRSLSTVLEYLDFATANPHFGTCIRHLKLDGESGYISFKTLYDILAATPRLTSLCLSHMSFYHWPIHTILLNPMERLELRSIGVGDGTCTSRHLLECFQGLFHDVKELELRSCDAGFLNSYHGSSRYLRLRKLTLPEPDAELLAFLCRTVTSCSSLDIVVSSALDTCEFMETVGSTVERLVFSCEVTDNKPTDYPALSLSACTSLCVAQILIRCDNRDLWSMRSKILQQLPCSIKDITLSLNMGTSDVFGHRISRHRPVFANLKELERLTFTLRPRTDVPQVEVSDVASFDIAHMNRQLQFALPDLHARGVLQPLAMPEDS